MPATGQLERLNSYECASEPHSRLRLQIDHYDGPLMLGGLWMRQDAGMADDLLSRILGELRERKEASRAAYEESQRLEAALAALDADGNVGGVRRPVARRGPRADVGRRAAPGANRDAIVAVVGQRPGVTAGEIASVTGIARATVSSTVARLAGSGTLERFQLPAGGVGFRVPSAPALGAAGTSAGAS
jgi:hypothetical protein